MRRNIQEKSLEKYLIIGNYMKKICKASVYANVEISNFFGKTNKLSKKLNQIHKDLEKLRSDLEDTMPISIREICNKKNINPLEIFYGEKDLITEWEVKNDK